MVLVGAHHAVDLVAVLAGVVVRDAGPEAGDLDQQLGPDETQERDAASHHVVLPGVVGDGDIDVPLVAGVVGQPAP